MALFEEVEVSGGAYSPLKITELEIGDSVAVYFGNYAARNSKEYGDFNVVEGLQINPAAKDEKSFFNEITPVSIIPNTQLQNMHSQGGFVAGKIYRITKSWNRGDTFKDGTKAKGYGFGVTELVNPKLAASLKTKFAEVAAGSSETAPKEALNIL